MIQRLRGKNGKTKGLFIREKSISSKLYYPVGWIMPLTEYRHPTFDNFVNIEGEILPHQEKTCSAVPDETE